MKPLVSVDELRKLMPRLNLHRAGLYAPLLSAAMFEFDITSKKRRSAFLAQLAHESVELRYMEEIASGAAYEGRKDLGNIKPGDGKLYKGRGPIQLTGRANYRKFGRLLDLDLEGSPKLAAVPEHGFRIAALFWQQKGLNDLADQLTLQGSGADWKLVRKITRKINGGYNGLNERWAYYKSAIDILHEDTDPSSPQSPVAPPAVRPAEPVHEQESAEGQAENSAIVSTEQTGTDLLGAAVKSEKAKNVGLKLWPRLVKHSSAGATFLWAIIEANKVASILVALVVLAGIAWLVYHNWQTVKARMLNLLQ
jgi:predicted chitinase